MSTAPSTLTTPITPITTRAALSGIVSAPAAQTRAAGARPTRADATLTPVGGASVTLVNLATGQVAATTTTNAEGVYQVDTITAGQNYEIRATKEVAGGTLSLSAIVTAPAAGAATDAPAKTRDLTPDTTVAAKAVVEQLAALASADPAGAASVTNLEAITTEMEKKRSQENAPSPDLTKPETVAAASTQPKEATAPDGTYIGEFGGDESGALVGVLKNGKFLLYAFGEEQQQSGGNQNNHNNQGGHDKPEDEEGVAGDINANGVIVAQAPGSNVKISGIFTGGVGVGVAASDGQNFTWKLTRISDPVAGLYRGVTAAGANTPESRLLALVSDARAVLFVGEHDGARMAGKGTVDGAGRISLTFADNRTGGGEVSGDLLRITAVSASGAAQTWEARRVTDPVNP